MKRININTGDRYNRLTIVKEIEPVIWKNIKNRQFECICDCGNQTNVVLNHLRTGNTKSCGCSNIDKENKKLKINIGERYGRLVIVKETDPLINGNKNVRRMICQCDCGNTKIILLNHLRQNKINSCGCLVLKHNMTGTRTYRSWTSLIQRCTNPKTTGYSDYGGRGVTVCDRWLNSFQNFLEDMGERPENTTIDRMEVNGNYEPSNCRWATPKEQSNNKRNNKKMNA